MKKFLNNKYIAVYAVIYAAAILTLLYVYDMPVNSTTVILPALLLLSGVTVAVQTKSSKPVLTAIPAISGLIFSVFYILLQCRILDPASPTENLFSRIICGQLFNVSAGVILSALLFIIRLAANNIKSYK